MYGVFSSVSKVNASLCNLFNHVSGLCKYTSTVSRRVLVIVLKSRDVYSAQSVEIHIYGYAPIEVRPRLDGVRSDIVSLLLFFIFNNLYTLKCALSINIAFRCHEDIICWICYGIRIVVNIIKQRMEMDGLSTKDP